MIAWPIGGNLPHAQSATGAIALLLLICALISQIRNAGMGIDKRNLNQRFSISWLLIGAGLVFAVIQCLPATWLGGLPTMLHPDGSTMAEVSTNTEGALSVLPSASREMLGNLIIAVALFFSAFCVLRRTVEIRIVFTAAMVAGIAVGFVGLIQKLAWNGKVLWCYELLQGGVPFGPFVNKNSAGGFLLACFAAGIFVLGNLLFSWQAISPGKKGLIKKIAGFIAEIKTKHLYAFAALAFLGFSIFATLSRGASLALGVAGLVSVILISTVNRSAIILALVLTAAGAGLAYYAEQTDVVAERMETLSDVENAAAPRMLHWEESLPYIQDHLIAGTGIGTHRYAYLSDQTRHYNKWFFHAENVYLETLGDFGVGGVVLLALTLIALLYSAWLLFRSSNRFDRALGVSGFCLLTGQMVSAFLDFGIYSPANYGIVAIMLGAIAGRAATLNRETKQNQKELRPLPGSNDAEPSGEIRNTPEKTDQRTRARYARVAILVIVLIGVAWSIRELHAVDCRDHAARLLKQYNRSGGALDEHVDRAQWLLNRAVEIRPDDYEVHYQTGQYHVARYRQDVLDLIVVPADEESPDTVAENNGTDRSDDEPETRAENTTDSTTNAVAESGQDPAAEPAPPSLGQLELPPAQSIEEAWPVTSLATLHRFANITSRMSEDAYNELAESPEVATHLAKAWDSFHRAEHYCHALAKTQFRLAQLSVLFDQGQSEAECILETHRRSPGNSKVLFDCGVLAINAGDVDETARLWSECLSYSRVFEKEIVQFGRAELPMRVFYERVLPQEPEELLRISRKYYSLPEQTLPKRLLLVHTRRLVEASDLPDAQKSYLRAETQRLSGDLEGAAINYALALDGNGQQVEWRILYATTLYELKQYDPAIQQLNECLRIPSRFRARASRLITRIKRERARNTRATDAD